MLKALKSMQKDDILKILYFQRKQSMKKKAMMCMAALCLSCGMTAYAAPETMPDGDVVKRRNVQFFVLSH